MNTPEIVFQPFPKITRLRRDVIITEKIDGTSGTVYVDDDGSVFAASRTRWITPQDDNYGFAAWVRDNQNQLRELGHGYHRGEWWGRGINRNYGIPDRRFSMFNVERFCLWNEIPKITPRHPTKDNPSTVSIQSVLPPCVGLVPVLYHGRFHTDTIDVVVETLEEWGSFAVKGFGNPEGVVVYHTASGVCFKQTIENDEKPKGAV